MRHRRAFTIIELLVVIAIIGLLIALLLPAVQAAREAARRAQCKNNFKQMGIAMASYHDSHGGFPIGRTGLGFQYAYQNPNRRSWVPAILPYLEQQQVYNAFNASASFFEPSNSTAVLTPISTFLCPSDTPCLQEPASSVPRVKGNFAANWGNTSYDQGTIATPSGGPIPAGVSVFRGAPFQANLSSNMAMLTDGSSATILVGETIIGQNAAAVSGIGQDHRGDLYNDDRNCSMFMTLTTPNSTVPDQMGTKSYCGYGIAGNPPCNGSSPAFNASRSRHPGGVAVLFADGHTSFITNSVARPVWQAIGSPSAGEVVDASSY